jgi:hypothetical protein
MKTLHFTKANNLSALHDQLLAALPDLRPTFNSRGEREAVIRVEGLGDHIWLTAPDSADIAAITAIVQAHDPTTLPPIPPTPSSQRVAELLAIPRSDWTVAQQRELLQLVAQTLTAES